MFEEPFDPVTSDIEVIFGESVDARYVSMAGEPVVLGSDSGRDILATADIYTCAGFGVWDNESELAAIGHSGSCDIGYQDEVRPQVDEVLEELGAYKGDCCLDVRVLTGPETSSKLYEPVLNGFRQLSEQDFSSFEQWKVNPENNSLNMETGVAIDLVNGDISLYYPSQDDHEPSPFKESECID